MIATNIQQSKHLLELGLDPKTADMCLCKNAQDTWFLCAYIPGEYDAHTVPAWSLSALLEVIPKECEPDIQKSPISGVYFAHWFIDMAPQITDDYIDPVTAAYKIVCCLLEQGVIKKGGQDE